MKKYEINIDIKYLEISEMILVRPYHGKTWRHTIENSQADD